MRQRRGQQELLEHCVQFEAGGGGLLGLGLGGASAATAPPPKPEWLDLGATAVGTLRWDGWVGSTQAAAEHAAQRLAREEEQEGSSEGGRGCVLGSGGAGGGSGGAGAGAEPVGAPCLGESLLGVQVICPAGGCHDAEQLLWSAGEVRAIAAAAMGKHRAAPAAAAAPAPAHPAPSSSAASAARPPKVPVVASVKRRRAKDNSGGGLEAAKERDFNFNFAHVDAIDALVVGASALVLVAYQSGYVRLYLVPIAGQQHVGAGLAGEHVCVELAYRFDSRKLHAVLAAGADSDDCCAAAFVGARSGENAVAVWELPRSLLGAPGAPPGTAAAALRAVAEAPPTAVQHDARLRGFGAAARCSGGGGGRLRCRALCGLGVGTLRVWDFATPTSGAAASGDQCFTLLCELKTNGSTLRHLRLLDGASRAASMNTADRDVQLWDLSAAAGAALGTAEAGAAAVSPARQVAPSPTRSPGSPAMYEQHRLLGAVKGSADTRALAGSHAVRMMPGDEALGFVSLSAAAAKARAPVVLDLPPPPSVAAAAGAGAAGQQRRKRQRGCREVKAVCGADGARCIAAHCSDGGVLVCRWDALAMPEYEGSPAWLEHGLNEGAAAAVALAASPGDAGAGAVLVALVDKDGQGERLCTAQRL